MTQPRRFLSGALFAAALALGAPGCGYNGLVSADEPVKANAAFRDLQAQLEGTENRISVERRRYNEAVQEYNVRCRSFPSVVVAKTFGFQPKEPFKATAANADKPPEVKF